MRRVPAIAVVAFVAGACTSVPRDAYFPAPGMPTTRMLAETLYRAAQSAGDDPARYSFALIRTRRITALSADDAIFYFSEGLASQPRAHVDALVAQAVAHEVLGHAGSRRRLSIGVSAGFTVVGFVLPGLGLADFVVNPLLVRAFTREQQLDADRRALDILAMMGHAAPRRTLASALRAAAAVNGPSPGGVLATEPDLATRLAALEPLERIGVAATPPARTRR